MKNSETKLVLWSVILVCVGIAIYLLGITINLLKYLGFYSDFISLVGFRLVHYSGIPILVGLIVLITKIYTTVHQVKRSRMTSNLIKHSNKITVALTAFNDEEAVKFAVRDFNESNFVNHLIVVDNNSQDNTVQVAKKLGADVVVESKPGYGSCVYRCLKELSKANTELVAICEGDFTFRSRDLDKFVAYISDSDCVMGSRISEQLQNGDTQLSTFMHFGNYFVGKLLESKYLGSVNITDVGCTFKLFRRDSLKTILPFLNPDINLSFNAHLIEVMMSSGLRCVEIPITFHKRVGLSKGGNKSTLAAIQVGFQMLKGILFGWKKYD